MQYLERDGTEFRNLVNYNNVRFRPMSRCLAGLCDCLWVASAHSHSFPCRIVHAHQSCQNAAKWVALRRAAATFIA